MVAIMNKNNEPNESNGNVIALCMFFTVAIFIMDSFIPLGVAGGVPYILVVLISLWSHNKKITLFAATGVTILTIAGFFSSPAGGEMWKVLANRFLAVFAIWVVAILSIQRQKMHDEREKALSQVKILSGLVPICSHCKKIRDDKGYWNNLEAYIENHSEALFSHGMCSQCSDELYGQEDWYIARKKKKTRT